MNDTGFINFYYKNIFHTTKNIFLTLLTLMIVMFFSIQGWYYLALTLLLSFISGSVLGTLVKYYPVYLLRKVFKNIEDIKLK